MLLEWVIHLKSGVPVVDAHFKLPTSRGKALMHVRCRVVHARMLPGKGENRPVAMGLLFEHLHGTSQAALDVFVSEQLVPAGFD